MMTFLKFCALVFGVVLVTLIFFPVFTNCGGNQQKSIARANIKQIAVGTMIYSGDYDGLLPSSFTTADFESALLPYTKNPSLFKPVKDFSTAPMFNYNLAGVDINSETSIKALGIKEPLNPNDVPMIYSLIIDKKEDSPAIIAYADASTKVFSPTKPFTPATLFATQYERNLPPTKPE